MRTHRRVRLTALTAAVVGTKMVLVGPLTMDEYGTVLARFKAYGFKDAFIRKIK